MIFKSVNKNVRSYGSYELNSEAQINDEILLSVQFQVWIPLGILIKDKVVKKEKKNKD